MLELVATGRGAQERLALTDITELVAGALWAIDKDTTW